MTENKQSQPETTPPTKTPAQTITPVKPPQNLKTSGPSPINAIAMDSANPAVSENKK
jgi:hypothetical protein